MTIHYNGGYFLLNEQLVRAEGANTHTARDLTQLSNYTVEAVNHLQDTPWEVNPYILDVVTKFFVMGDNLTVDGKGYTNLNLITPDGVEYVERVKKQEVVLRIEPPIDPALDLTNADMRMLDKEEWDALTPAEKKVQRAKRGTHRRKFDEEMGIHRATLRIYETAKEMGAFETFYYPHNLDFRTRIYPIPNDLTPQSNDFAKGLLRFQRPKKLGRDGLYWLGFMVATHYGNDKLHPDQRYEWAIDNIEEFGPWVDDPVSNRGWLETDKPFQFLAAAHTFVWAIRSGDPETFFSHIPVNLDGSCNGAQHLSIMGRDVVGAKATNCMASNKREDLYAEVGERVYEQVLTDHDNGNPMAAEWIDKMSDPSERRKVVKRSVMTVPYGVTEYGIADFMMKDGHVSDEADNKWESAKYMRDLIWGSIGMTLKNGQKIQQWFSECARVCAEEGKPLVWDTPAGSKVTQAYMNLIQKRVHAYGMKFYVYNEPTDEEIEEEFLGRIGMDTDAMMSAAPPNVVHSCDAAHLQITVCRMADAGIKDFSMIHDSFGCHAADVSLMRDILRQTAVDMYAGNFLQEWKESVEKYSGLTMPEMDFELGEFDVNEILRSVYFFS